MLAGLSRGQSYMLGFIVLVLGTVAIGWLGKSMLDAELGGDADFWHAGYYRDASMERVFTIGFVPTATESDVRRYAKQLTHTPGHSTTALFYPEGSRIPAQVVTGAASMAEARQALRIAGGASPWRYATVKDAQGVVRLVDCEAEPNDPLCRF